MQISYHILPLSLTLLPLLSDFLGLLYFTPNSHYSFTPISLRIFHPFFASISNITLPLSTLSLILLPYSLPFSTHTLSSLSFTPHSYLALSLPSFPISPPSHSTISPHYLTKVFYPTLQFLSLALWTHPSNSFTPLYPIISPTFSLSLFSHPTPPTPLTYSPLLLTPLTLSHFPYSFSPLSPSPPTGMEVYTCR